jgi:zinc/manganese transport system permease protein
MLQLVQTLGLPFLACIIMGSILGYLGTHVLKREVIFVDIALAQVASVGAIVGHLVFEAHHNSLLSYGCSLLAVFVVATFYAVARKFIVQISIEAVIGITYAVAAAAALFLVGIAPGGHIHVQQILSGSLLWTNRRDVVLAVVLFSAVGFSFYLVRKPLNSISNNYQQAFDKGIRLVFWDFIFYLLLGVVITLSVQMGGVVVVFAYLIIPATISAILTSSPGVKLIIILAAIGLASVSGLLFAYYLDFSIGPMIALMLGAELVTAAAFGKICLSYRQ